MKFFVTLARICNGILCRHPRFIVNKRRIDVAPIELFIDSRRLEPPIALVCDDVVAALPLNAGIADMAELAVLDI